MKKNKIASSLIEALVVMAILTIGLVWVYSFFSKSRAFLDWVSAKIEAIEIAREWIEALENIRNTNWMRFQANIDNCWDVLNYNTECIWWISMVDKIWWTESNPKIYILKNDNWLWKLEQKNQSWNFSDSNYRQTFLVWKDKDNWRYCQTVDNTNCITKWSDWKTIIWNYTRKISVIWVIQRWNKVVKLKVSSIVEWTDQSVYWVRKIELNNLMTNYKR